MVMNDKSIVECVGGLIFDSKKRICLQERDNKKEINCPGLWGLFGGSTSKNEDLKIALRREIYEELCIHPTRIDFFLTLEVDSFIYQDQIRRRSFFSIFLTEEEKSKIILKEGKSYKFFSVDQLPEPKKLAPVDSCAIIMFAHHFLQPRQITPVI